jgi:hypothetical protein
MQRLVDWEDRLNALIAERMFAPFVFGAHDCCLWGADAVHAQTGEDHGAAFRGKYDDADGAAAALRQFGGGTITRTFDAFLPRRDVALLRRGDIVMIGDGRDGSIGVVIGGDALFVDDIEDRLLRVRRDLWTRGWGLD